MTGSIPTFRNVTELKYLNLADNRVTGSIPPDVNSLTGLEVLDLTNNALSGDVPNLNTLGNLRILKVGNNQLTALPSLLSLHSLESLEAQSNALRRIDDFRDLSSLTNLKHLNLANNFIDGAVPVVRGLAKLQVVDLSNNKFSSLIQNGFDQLPQLTVLNLADNDNANELWLPSLTNATRLQQLSLSRSRFSGRLSDLFLSDQLVVLDAEKTGIRGDLAPLSRLISLEQLVLNDNHLSGEVPDLAVMSRLVTLNLARNELVGSIGDGLGRLRHLESVQLQRNMFKGEFPSLNASALSLRQLILDQNSFSGDLGWIGNAKRLRQLQLFANQFSGTLPSNLASLTELVVLNVCKNRLGGDFPPLRGQTALRVLLLHDNQFGGGLDSLPDTIFERNSSVKTDEQNSYSNILLLTQNRFSCELPRSSQQVGSGRTDWLFRLVALGNAFDDDIPIWVAESEQNAKLLWVPRFQSYKWYVIVVFGSFLLTIPYLSITSWKLFKAVLQNMRLCHERLFGLFRSAVRVCGCMLLYGGVMAFVYSQGANLYKCGNTMNKISIIYLTSKAVERVVAVLLVGFTLFSILCLYYIRSVDRQFSGTLHRSSRGLLNRFKQTRSAWQTSAFVFQVTCAAFVWALSIAILGIPTGILILYNTLPLSDQWYADPVISTCLPWIASVCLSVNSMYIVPWICRTVCGWIKVMNETAEDGELTDTQQKWALRLTLLSRAILSMWLPVAVAIFMDQGCFQNWKRFWTDCVKHPEHFNIVFEEVQVLRSQDVCDRAYPHGRCSRRVIEILAGLRAKTLMLDMFVSPALLFLVYKLQIYGRLQSLRCCCTWGPRSYAAPTQGRSRLLQPQDDDLTYHRPPGALSACLSCCLGWFSSSDRFERNMRRIGTRRARKGISSSTYALLITSWLDAAFILGGMVPIVLPIVMITLLTHWVVLRGLTTMANEIKNTVPPPLLFLTMSIVSQSALSAWFFYDNQLAGEEIVRWGSVGCAVLLILSYLLVRPAGPKQESDDRDGVIREASLRYMIRQKGVKFGFVRDSRRMRKDELLHDRMLGTGDNL
eukprot:c18164_g1_i1.p1 GENE.c18164_g1_i1~~c18164_g1_i1.p1  ORF type:complete len:1118 (-),score=246.16 c18164_g1_i1:82-3255(-)